jgi:predicted dehydrogenase
LTNSFTYEIVFYKRKFTKELVVAFKIRQTPDMPKKPRPIVSLGAGGIVRDAHLPAYKKAGFEVVGMFDLDRAKSSALAKQYGIKEVFSKLQETVTSVPENVIFDVAVPASAIMDILPHLPKGAAVLIQKPMGSNLKEAKAIRDLCRKKQFAAAVNFQMRYAPYVLAAKSLIERGAIGDVHDVEVRLTVNTPWYMWSFFEGIPRVEILYHSIHYLDLMRSFLGEPKGIYAKTVKHPKTQKLSSTRSTIILDYGDTTRANIEANHGHDFGLTHQESYVKWEGTKGAIKAKIGLLLNYPKGEPDAFEYCILEQNKKPRWKSIAVKGSWFPDAFIGSMASLMRYVEGSSKVLPTHVDDAYKSMALVEAAHRSSDGGGVAIPR